MKKNMIKLVVFNEEESVALKNLLVLSCNSVRKSSMSNDDKKIIEEILLYFWDSITIDKEYLRKATHEQ